MDLHLADLLSDDDDESPGSGAPGDSAPDAQAVCDAEAGPSDVQPAPQQPAPQQAAQQQPAQQPAAQQPTHEEAKERQPTQQPAPQSVGGAEHVAAARVSADVEVLEAREAKLARQSASMQAEYEEVGKQIARKRKELALLQEEYAAMGSQIATRRKELERVRAKRRALESAPTAARRAPPRQAEPPAKQQRVAEQGRAAPAREAPRRRAEGGSTLFGGAVGAAEARDRARERMGYAKPSWVCPFSNIRVNDTKMGNLDLQQTMKFSQSESKRLDQIEKYEVANRNEVAARAAASSGARPKKLLVTTVAVAAERITVKTSANGKAFSVWRLFDMQHTTMSLFLFGTSHSDMRLHKGMVLCLLDACVDDKERKGVSLAVDDSSQVVVVGTAADFGCCKGTRKDGAQCTMFVNKAKSEFCDYHVGAAFQRSKTARPELSTSSLPVRPGARRAPASGGSGGIRNRLAMQDKKMGGTYSSSLSKSSAMGGAGARSTFRSNDGGAHGRGHLSNVGITKNPNVGVLSAADLAARRNTDEAIRKKTKVVQYSKEQLGEIAANPNVSVKNSRGSKYVTTLSRGETNAGGGRDDGLDELGNVSKEIQLQTKPRPSTAPGAATRAGGGGKMMTLTIDNGPADAHARAVEMIRARGGLRVRDPNDPHAATKARLAAGKSKSTAAKGAVKPANPTSLAGRVAFMSADRAATAAPEAERPVSDRLTPLEIEVLRVARTKKAESGDTSLCVAELRQLEGFKHYNSLQLQRAIEWLQRTKRLSPPPPATGCAGAPAEAPALVEPLKSTAGRGTFAEVFGGMSAPGADEVDYEAMAAPVHNAAIASTMDALAEKEKLAEHLSTITRKKVKAWRCADCAKTFQRYPALCKEKGHRLTQCDATERYFRCAHCNRHTVTIFKFPTAPCQCGSLEWRKDTAFRGGGALGKEVAGEEVIASREAFNASVGRHCVNDRGGDDRANVELRSMNDTLAQ